MGASGTVIPFENEPGESSHSRVIGWMVKQLRECLEHIANGPKGCSAGWRASLLLLGQCLESVQESRVDFIHGAC